MKQKIEELDEELDTYSMKSFILNLVNIHHYKKNDKITKAHRRMC